MIKGTLKKPDGTDLITFDIPQSLHETKLSQLVDFLVASRELDDSKPERDAISTMTIAVGEFFGLDLETLLMASSGFFGADRSSFTGSISSLYGYIVKMIADFNPSLLPPAKCSFEYAGHKYTIPTIVEQTIAGEFRLPDLSVAEVIEVSEVARFKHQSTTNVGDPNGKLRKRINDMIAENIKQAGGTDIDNIITDAGEKVYHAEIERAGDPNGSLAFTYYLHTLSILCRRDGEQLPFEDSARELWIQDRAKHFEGIDAATALNVDFFLTNISKSYEGKRIVGGFLKNLCFAVVAATSNRNATRMNAPSRIRKTYSKKSVGVN